MPTLHRFHCYVYVSFEADGVRNTVVNQPLHLLHFESSTRQFL
jgi:hypothetical protein